MKQAYPLSWPEEWPRTKHPKASRFKTTLARSIANVEEELQRFANDSGKKIERLLISSNFTLTDRNPRDAGVAVYFEWDGLSTCIAVDRYPRIEENLQAIFHCIEAERTKLRHGGLNLVRAAFRGYAALPPPTSARPWSMVLELILPCTLADAEASYHRLAQKMHPDTGGSQSAMSELNAAIAEARRELS